MTIFLFIYAGILRRPALQTRKCCKIPMSSENIPELPAITLLGDEEAIMDDHYGDEEVEGPYNTLEKKLERLEQFKNQECDQTLDEAYSGVSVTEQEQSTNGNSVN